MKSKYLVLSTFLLAGLVACEKDNLQKGNDGDLTDGAYVQFSLNVSGGPETKAPSTDTDPGNKQEQAVKDVCLVFVGLNDSGAETTISHVETIAKAQLTPGNAVPGAGDIISYNTPVFKLAGGDYNLYAVVNATDDVKAKLVEGQALNLDEVLTSTDDSVLGAENESGDTPKTYFLMSNLRDSKTLIDNLNKETHTAQNPYKAKIEVERALAKISYKDGKTQRVYTFPVTTRDIQTGTSEVTGNVTAKLVSMAVFNRNTKTYLFGREENATDPNYGEDKYWIDPNFANTKTDDNTPTTLTDFVNPYNYLDLGTEANVLYPHDYVMENTARADSQYEDQLTGVAFKVTYEPEGKVWTTNADLNITAARDTDDPTFYVYNTLLFANKEAIVNYYTAFGDQAKVAEVVAALGGDISDKKVRKDIQDKYYITVYYKAEGYHLACIRHAQLAKYEYNAKDGEHMPMEYGVVRNHWYQLSVNTINGFGRVTDSGTPPPPEDPNANIQVTIDIMPWKVIDNEIDF